MTVDDQGATPLTDRELDVLADVERGLARTDPPTGTRAAPDRRPGLMALWLGAACTAVTVTALLAGPGAALLVAAAGGAGLVAMMVSFARRDP
ncbi:DUF3040 family protein [Pseudonocardia sediminis]|uniref:DUF3040 family protein n=1 Tax=Pseudonocardia sediminis TaxID=1397368 RepID=A0A4Q7V1N5_PSEST|nr:DUF3040 domain-containing protein [Pseudonocardia sediminis]RZT86479.1 DUF3040 family protein [Pseudonocardia sediminis]